MALTSEITFKVTGTYTAAKDLSTVTDPLALSKSIPLASGTGANQADLLFHDQRTIAASSNDDLDLADRYRIHLETRLLSSKLKLSTFLQRPQTPIPLL